jgi:soluble lytic murein transglycosylase-like protein
MPDANGGVDALIARHAAANNIPEDLVRRVIKRESGGNPRAVSKGNFGLMQIKLATARGLGYRGTAAGLLDADTNMTYAVKYLAGAYRVANGNAIAQCITTPPVITTQRRTKAFQSLPAPAPPIHLGGRAISSSARIKSCVHSTIAA